MRDLLGASQASDGDVCQRCGTQEVDLFSMCRLPLIARLAEDCLATAST